MPPSMHGRAWLLYVAPSSMLTLHRHIQGKKEMKSGKKQDRPEKNRRPYWLLRSGEAARRVKCRRGACTGQGLGVILSAVFHCLHYRKTYWR